MQYNGRITLEMGRALAASCGYYMSRVCDTKKNNGENYCIVDGGINQLHYDGQICGMKKPYFEVISDNRNDSRKTGRCAVLYVRQMICLLKMYV